MATNPTVLTPPETPEPQAEREPTLRELLLEDPDITSSEAPAEAEPEPSGEQDPQPDPPEAEPAEAEEAPEGEPETEEEEADQDEISEDEESEVESEEVEPEEEENALLAQLPKPLRDRFERQQRVNREDREKRQAAEAERDQLKDQLDAAQTQSVRLEPSPENPLSDVFDDAKIAEYEKQQRGLIEWAISHPEGTEVNDQIYEPADVARIKYQAEEALRKFPDQRRKWLADNAASREAARKTHPALFRDGSEENNLFKELVGMDAGILGHRALPEIVALMSDGLKVRKGTHKLIPYKDPKTSKAQPEPKAKAKPDPPAGPTAPTGAPGPTAHKREPDHAAAIRAARERGDDNAEADAIAASLNL